MLLHSYAKMLPKADRYTIGQESLNYTLKIIQLIFQACYKSPDKKYLYLEEADLKLKILKIMIRLLFDIKSLDLKKYLALQEALQQVGNMLGGWLKSLK